MVLLSRAAAKHHNPAGWYNISLYQCLLLRYSPPSRLELNYKQGDNDHAHDQSCGSRWGGSDDGWESYRD